MSNESLTVKRTSPEAKEYSIPKVTAKVIMEVVEGVCYYKNNGFTLEDAMNYASISDVYARRALESADQLGLILEKDGKFFHSLEANDVARASVDQRPVIFRKFLQRYEPFILFIMLVGRGNQPNVSARKIQVIYKVSSKPDVIRSSLINWGEYAGVLASEKGKITLRVETEKLSAEYLHELLEALEHDIKARVYIAGKLGGETFGYLTHDEIEFFVKAIRKHESEPRNAIEDAGKAFEDFLRRVAIDKGVEAADCKGIGQLVSKLKGENIIHQKQLEMCEYVNSLRLAAAHSKEAGTMITWKINADAAIEVILTSLTAVRSIFLYVFKKVTEF